MATEPRLFHSLDEYDDCLFDHSLRIPPLQDPPPFMPIDRPPPLEPSALVDTGAHHVTAKLTSAKKVALKAQLVGDDIVSMSHVTAQQGHRQPAPGDLDGPRKRQKLDAHQQKMDFVQLPKPIAKAKVDRPLPFEPVSILNELHEPPPSAALFPPITPNTSQRACQRLHDIRFQANAPTQAAEHLPPPIAQPGVENKSETGNGGPRKRVRLRGRRQWTKEETDQLLEGVAIYGIGKWKKIMNHPDFSFQSERTTVDLKDRYRTCRMMEEKAMENPPEDNFEEAMNSDLSHGTFTAVNNARLTPSKTSVRRAPRWTKQEDAALAKGYRIYGFQWTAIAKDVNLELQQRTGTQVRDRFRLMFPIHYQSSIPIPLNEKTKPRPKPKLRTVFDLQLAGSPQDLVVANTPFNDPRRLAQPLSPRSPGAYKPFDGPVKPPPEPDPVDKRTEDDSAVVAGRLSPEEQSRQSSCAVEEFRHLGIMGLLNDEDDDEHVSRLPSLKYTYEDWGQDSVTLPPLVWEDMAPRPLFELD